MRNLQFWVILIFISGLNIQAQPSKAFDIDFKDPKSVVNAIFYAAQTKDFEVLQCLCDPFSKNDGDTRSLCSMSSLLAQTSEFGGNSATHQAINQFVQMFELGRLSGPITYEEIEGIKYANVPFLFNHPGGENRSNESMKLVNRYGNWYFSSF